MIALFHFFLTSKEQNCFFKTVKTVHIFHFSLLWTIGQSDSILRSKSFVLFSHVSKCVAQLGGISLLLRASLESHYDYPTPTPTCRVVRLLVVTADNTPDVTETLMITWLLLLPYPNGNQIAENDHNECVRVFIRGNVSKLCGIISWVGIWSGFSISTYYLLKHFLRILI